jgi:hypothetical protein
MSALPVSRRLVAVVAASGLCLTGLVLATTASAAGPCPTYTDPAGDAVLGSPALDPAIGEPDLDLLAVSHSVDAGVFTSVIKVAKLSTGGSDKSFGDSFQALFTVSGKAVSVRTGRDASNPVADPTETSSLSVAGTVAPAKVTAKYDTTASTVTISVATADLEKAVGASLAGRPFSAMSAKAASFYPNPAPSPANYSGLVYDTATAPATATYVFGGSCSGDGTGQVVTPTGSPTPTPTITPLPRTDGEPVLFDQPRKGCVTYKDPAGDADPSGTGQYNEAEVDVTQVNLKSAAEGLQVFVKVADLTASRFPLFDSSFYDVSLSVGGKAIVVSVDQDGKATSTVGGTANADLKAAAKLDTKNSVVIVTLPTDGLTKVLGAPLAQGAAVTNTAISTGLADSTTGFPAPADDAAGVKPEEKTYAYGDNTCFLPPAGKAFVDGLTGVYTDSATVVGSLQDVDEANVPGASLTLTIAGLPAVTAVTNGDGDATFRFPVTLPAGTRKAVLSFAGNATVGATKAEDSFVVAVESTVLKAVASKGAVTATLADNDKHAIAKRVVVFTVGSKSTKVTTNARGQALLKGVVEGAVVKVSFGAVPTYYAAAKPVTVKGL